MKKKIILTVIRALLSAGLLTAGILLLWRYEYFSAFSQIDNYVGAAPVALVIIAEGCLVPLVWIKPERRRAAECIILALFGVGSAALFPNALRGNWYLFASNPRSGDTIPDLSVYQPYAEGNVLAKPDGKTTLTLSENLPVVDGALALYPLYAAFVESVYDAQACLSSESMQFTNTVEAFNALIAGERDIIFTASASASQMEQAKKAGVELHFTPIGREAFVFLAGKSNPVDNLTYSQIRNIYSGKTAKWATLGWKEGGDIIAYQRPEGSGSQTGLQWVMGDMPIVSPQPLPDPSLIGTDSLMQQMSVEWKGVQPALGYSYRYFATTMYPNAGAKLLSVDGVAPTNENVQSGAYPFTVNFYAVTRCEPSGNSKLLIDWILSPQGQSLVEKTGYAPVA